jgi:hypothetical protein
MIFGAIFSFPAMIGRWVASLICRWHYTKMQKLFGFR